MKGGVYFRRWQKSDNKEDYRQAMVDYTQALRLSPDPRIYFGRGGIRLEFGDYDGAIADFTSSISLALEFSKMGGQGPYWFRGIAYQKKGDHARAILDFSEDFRRTPSPKHVLLQRSLSYEELGRKEEAIADLQSALSIDPKFDRAREGLKRLSVKP